jgi:PTS system mannose-specific IIC component
MGCNLIASALIAVFFALINYKVEQLKNGRPALAADAAATLDDEEEEDI